MDVLVMVAQLLLALSILVGVHEAGHMLSAKYFGMRVEKFSIGFPPKIFSFTKGETEYSLGAVPLGGFVKITGMVDESLDTANLSKEPEPYEFRAKPAWQRLIVMMGGIIVNIIFGVIMFIIIYMVFGERYYSRETVNQHGIVAYELGQRVGLQTGDRILQVNGEDFSRFPHDVLNPDVLLREDSYYTVLRGNDTLRVDIPSTLISDLSARQPFISPALPYRVGKVVDSSNAQKAGITDGDTIISVEGQNVEYFHQLQETLQKHKATSVSIRVRQDGAINEFPVQVDTAGRIGFQPEFMLEEDTMFFSFGEAVPIGTQRAFSVITNTVQALGQIFTGRLKASESVAGPIFIAREFGPDWVWERFWLLTASLSMILAFMNFLPIPALDGGHVMFLLYEMIAGRKPSDRFLENAQKVGMLLLLLLMVFVFGNDIYRIIFT